MVDNALFEKKKKGGGSHWEYDCHVFFNLFKGPLLDPSPRAFCLLFLKPYLEAMSIYALESQWKNLFCYLWNYEDEKTENQPF